MDISNRQLVASDVLSFGEHVVFQEGQSALQFSYAAGSKSLKVRTLEYRKYGRPVLDKFIRKGCMRQEGQTTHEGLIAPSFPGFVCWAGRKLVLGQLVEDDVEDETAIAVDIFSDREDWDTAVCDAESLEILSRQD